MVMLRGQGGVCVCVCRGNGGLIYKHHSGVNDSLITTGDVFVFEVCESGCQHTGNHESMKWCVSRQRWKILYHW